MQLLRRHTRCGPRYQAGSESRIKDTVGCLCNHTRRQLQLSLKGSSADSATRRSYDSASALPEEQANKPAKSDVSEALRDSGKIDYHSATTNLTADCGYHGSVFDLQRLACPARAGYLFRLTVARAKSMEPF